jgi:DNA-binding CsgD family transcriptional regulator
LLLAGLAALQEDCAAARVKYEESLAVALEIGQTGFIASGLKGLGCVVAAQELYTWAALLWGAAEHLRESRSVAISQAIYKRMVAAARTQLGEQAFAAAWAEGRTMTPEQAFASQGRTTRSVLIPAEGSSVPPMKSAVYPDGLTTREVEVLRLVAQGLTNEQVAEQLVISPRMVNSHLTSIFNKIGVSSRGAATRYAIEHHLA